MLIEEFLSREVFKRFPKPHYLLGKQMEEWDNYDWNNFKSIIKKLI